MKRSSDKVFLDAHYLIARLNPRDEWHRAALEADRRLAKSVLRITTHEVFLEVLAGVSSFRPLRKMAVEMIRAMRHGSRRE